MLHLDTQSQRTLYNKLNDIIQINWHDNRSQIKAKVKYINREICATRNKINVTWL